MSERRGLFGELSWFQVVVGVLAAVTAAWIASSLGVAGTLIGTAVASFVASISAALYGRTLDKGKTLLVQTASGAVIEETVHHGDVGDALQRAADEDHSAVERARIVGAPERRLHWKTIIATTITVLLLSLAAITTVELLTKQTFGGGNGTTIGDTFSGNSDKSADKPDKSKDTPVPKPTPTPSVTATTPTPAPTATTPVPTEPTPTPTPAVTESTPAPDAPAE